VADTQCYDEPDERGGHAECGPGVLLDAGEEDAERREADQMAPGDRLHL
jgi:hypothetical protein